MILLNLCFSSKTFWASFLLSNLIITLPVSLNLWKATVLIASITTPSFSKIRMTCSSRRSFVILFGTPGFRWIHEASIVKVCAYFSPIQLFCRLIFYDSWKVTWKFFRSHYFSLKSFIFFFQIIEFGFDNIQFFSKLFIAID